MWQSKAHINTSLWSFSFVYYLDRYPTNFFVLNLLYEKVVSHSGTLWSAGLTQPWGKPWREDVLPSSPSSETTQVTKGGGGGSDVIRKRAAGVKKGHCCSNERVFPIRIISWSVFIYLLHRHVTVDWNLISFSEQIDEQRWKCMWIGKPIQMFYKWENKEYLLRYLLARI